MKLNLTIAEGLLRMMQGASMPASKLRHSQMEELINEGLVLQQVMGRTRTLLYVSNAPALNDYLFQRYGIVDVPAYLQVMTDAAAGREDMVRVSANSKAEYRGTFSGFLINCAQPVAGTMNGIPTSIMPLPGTWTFLHSPENFVPDADVVIAGVENVACFAQPELLQRFLPMQKLLFVSRYPQQQSATLRKWLLSIPNSYVHFGDYDPAGIAIYVAEYYKHLGNRAHFFVPKNIEQLIARYGNTHLYDQQQLPTEPLTDPALQALVALIHRHRKGLEQEALLLPEADNSFTN